MSQQQQDFLYMTAVIYDMFVNMYLQYILINVDNLTYLSFICEIHFLNFFFGTT